MRLPRVHAALVFVLTSCGRSDDGKVLTRLHPTEPSALSPGNLTGQDEDPSILVARSGDALHAAWYSNRAGTHPGGRQRKEIFVARSTDGLGWTDPPVQATDDPEWSFYPSLAQSQDGSFHLTWMRWDLTPAACVPDTATPCVGYAQRILYNRSADGLAWNTADEQEIAGGPDDELPSILAASDGRLLVYFDSSLRVGPTRQIFVAVHDGTGWHAPVEASGANSDTLHDTFPHVVERAPGSFLMTWTRHPTTDRLFSPSAETMLSTSSDGLNWTAPVVASNPSPGTIDVFPYLYPDHSNQHWSVMWVTENGTVEVPVDDVEGAIPVTVQIPAGGYTPRLAPTPTPGIYWAAWAEGSDPDQKIRQRFLMK
jgi:hypothetical protein